MANERFTPELAFVNEFEANVQNALKAVGLEDRVYGTPLSRSIVLENTPQALREESWKWGEQAKASRRAFERVEVRDITMRDKTEDLFQLRKDVKESTDSLSFAANTLRQLRDDLGEMQHTTVIPLAKDLPAMFADAIRKTQMPDAISHVMDGGMLLAEAADKIAYAKPGLVPKTPKQFAQKVLIPILDEAIGEADRRMASMADGLAHREQRHQRIATANSLAAQVGEAEVTSRALFQASNLVRGVWSNALEAGALTAPELNSSTLNVKHPAEFEDAHQLDQYIEEIAVVAKQQFDPNFKPALDKGAEGHGIG